MRSQGIEATGIFTALDQAPLTSHPRYGMPQALSELGEQGLYFAGTEVAPEFGGYLEGALEAAENALFEGSLEAVENLPQQIL